MATRQSTVDFVLDQLQPLRGVRARKMFGEYGLFYGEKMVAMACDDQLFIKITPAGKALAGDHYQEGEPYPGAKPAMLVAAADLEDHERLCELVRVTAAELPQRKPKSRLSRRTKATARPRRR